MTNITYEGCHVWSDHGFIRGAVVILTLPKRGDIQAQVRWCAEGRAGLKFLAGLSAVDDGRARIGV